MIHLVKTTNRYGMTLSTELQGKLINLLQDDSLQVTEQIQSLWSGYGQIVRCTSQLHQTHYIVKCISPEQKHAHPRGWNTDVSHQRKLKSYMVESAFYQTLAPQLDARCRVPQLIASQTSPTETLLVMEDLDAMGFDRRIKSMNMDALAQCVRWLAFFHAKCWQIENKKVWRRGGYWHLSTRQDEWQAMPEGTLKQQAKVIDACLNQAQFQTLIHGDAKFANFCFDEPLTVTAAVDFQYTGYASPVKDLVCLFSSALTDDALQYYDIRLIDAYLSQLTQAIQFYQLDINIAQVSREVSALYSFAWADKYRFLLGWNGQSNKITRYMQQQTDKALSRLA